MVGSLQYLAFTRPDITFDVNIICQAMHSPDERHWQGVKNILRYLNATADLQFFILASPSNSLAAYSNAD